MEIQLANTTDAGFASPGCLEESYGLHSGDFKALAAANVLAGQHIFGADHVGLRFGETGAVTFIRVSGETVLLAANQPAQLVLVSLAAMRTGKGVRARLGLFFKKIAFFHRFEPRFQTRPGKSIPYSRRGGKRPGGGKHGDKEKAEEIFRDQSGEVEC